MFDGKLGTWNITPVTVSYWYGLKNLVDPTPFWHVPPVHYYVLNECKSNMDVCVETPYFYWSTQNVM